MADTYYLLFGLIHLFITSVVIIVAIIKRGKIIQSEVWNINKYGKYIVILLFINFIIQCVMSITMIINGFHSDRFLGFVFESLALFQQASYCFMIFFMGGLFNESVYDNNKIAIPISIVCFNEIISFHFILNKFVFYTNESIYKYKST